MKTKKFHNSKTKLGNIEKKVDDRVPKGLRVSKHRKYTNWFQLNLWPPIIANLKKYHGN